MNTAISVSHVTHVIDKKFEDFIAAFESRLGRYDIGAYQNLLADSKNTAVVEEILTSQEGRSGLMIFATYDHGSLLAIKGLPQKARQYVVGNPLIAAQMTKHDIRAGLYAPLRVLIYAGPTGKVQVEYDLPSTLFGQFGNPAIDKVAQGLDQKLKSLIDSCVDH